MKYSFQVDFPATRMIKSEASINRPVNLTAQLKLTKINCTKIWKDSQKKTMLIGT